MMQMEHLAWSLRRKIGNHWMMVKEFEDGDERLRVRGREGDERMMRRNDKDRE